MAQGLQPPLFLSSEDELALVEPMCILWPLKSKKRVYKLSSAKKKLIHSNKQTKDVHCTFLLLAHTQTLSELLYVRLCVCVGLRVCMCARLCECVRVRVRVCTDIRVYTMCANNSNGLTPPLHTHLKNKVPKRISAASFGSLRRGPKISTYADNLVTSIIAFFLPIFLNNYNADFCKKKSFWVTPTPICK